MDGSAGPIMNKIPQIIGSESFRRDQRQVRALKGKLLIAVEKKRVGEVSGMPFLFYDGVVVVPTFVDDF